MNLSSAWRAPVLLIVAAAACHKDPEVTTRVVTAWAPATCAPGASAYVAYDGLGDFDAPASQASHALSDVGTPLDEVAGGSRAIDVTSQDRGVTWLGVAPVAPSGDVDALILPQWQACRLSGAVDARVAPVLAPFGDRRVMIFGSGPANPRPPTWVARLDEGALAPVTGDVVVPRVGATATAFGGGVLVAGGTAVDGSGPQDTAEVYVPASDAFDPSRRITLDVARTGHGAAVLVTGETLLVGGAGSDGKTPLDSMVVVDPKAAQPLRPVATHLVKSRIAPTVLVLASGEVLVAGGVDASGAGVSTLEWFTADVSKPEPGTPDLVTGSAVAFVAMQSGGALAVVAPPAMPPKGFQNVWRIRPDHVIEPATPIGVPLTAPVLFGNAQDEPLLWTGSAWLQWKPWDAKFEAPPVTATTAPPVGAAATSPDPGLAAWLSADTQAFVALRFDVRGAYSALAGPLLAGSAGEVAPDRLPAPGGVAYAPSTGLSLSQAATAYVTDRTYADFALDVDTTCAQLAAVVLRDELGAELVVGGPSCGFTGAATGCTVGGGGAATLHVARTGTSVTWTLGALSGTCGAPLRDGARVSIGLRAATPSAGGVASNLRIARTPTGG